MIPRDGVILANDKNTIWIYQQQDGLYNYDPLNSMLRHYEIPFSNSKCKIWARKQKTYTIAKIE